MLSVLAAIGIMSAINEEAHLILESIQNKESVKIGCKEFVTGTFEETPVVFAFAGVGKVSAAATATLMISRFSVESIVFTGVAGGGSDTQIGDIVIGNAYLQHDLDLRPIFSQFHILSLNKQVLKADEKMCERMTTAAKRYLAKGVAFPELGILHPKVHEGTIVSGDQFIFNPAHHAAIDENVRTVLPDGFHAIEMEGEAVAQVCNELNIPFVVFRAISDKADDAAPVNFLTFINHVASQYSFDILKEYITLRKTEVLQD